MPSLDTLAALVGAVSLSILLVLVIRYIAGRLAGNHGSDVRVVWYLFFLALIATLLVAWWGIAAGALGTGGEFTGTGGAVLRTLLLAVLDFETSAKVYGALVALVVLPQVGSWALSGLSGCASKPILVEAAFRFFFWSLVKTFVVAAGVIAAVVAFSLAYSWGDLTVVKVSRLALTALGSITASFVLLFFYRDLHLPKGETESTEGQPQLQRLASRVSAWMNRNIQQL